jgi:hypothetical protein
MKSLGKLLEGDATLARLAGEGGEWNEPGEGERAG